MKSALLFIYTETPLHAGTGSSVSVVDLPIQRERTTQYPIVQGSGVKGALRSQVNDPEKSYVETIFGPEEIKAQKPGHAGAVAVGEAQIVLFPVRSLAGVFAYATSPFVIARLARLTQQAGIALPFTPPAPAPPVGNALITSNSKIIADGQSVVLEEFSFSAQKDANCDALARWLANYAFPAGEEYAYWRNKVKDSLIILSDDDFRDFVVNSTEITTRVRLETATKTVASGALWSQESLPADALLMSAIVARAPRGGQNGLRSAEDVLEVLGNADYLPARIQLGGDETTGQGMVALQWVK